MEFSMHERTKPLALVAATLVCVMVSSAILLGVAFADDEKAVKRVGAVCGLKKFEEGKESFKTKARGIGKLMVNLGEETEYYKVTTKSLSAVKEKDVLHVLGIYQEGRKDVEEPEIVGPLSFASGDFPVPQLPEQIAKRKNMKWGSGKVRMREGKTYVDKYVLLTGARTIAVFSKVKKGDLTSLDKGIVHVYGDLGEKVKGQREIPLAAKRVCIIDPGVPQKEYPYLFLAGIERPTAPSVGEDGDGTDEPKSER